jgi:hypothetical protein
MTETVNRPIDGIYARAAIAEVLNLLPIVRWDRLTFDPEPGADGAPAEAAVYGWVEREDGRADFVLIQFDVFDRGARWRNYFSSSAERSEEIYRLLTGLPEVVDGAENDHIACERVEDVIGDFAKNADRLDDRRPPSTVPAPRFWSGEEALAELYGSVRYSYERSALDGLVIKAELGWRCQAPLAADGALPCGYLNVPGVADGGNGETHCINCGAPRRDDG